MRLVAIAVALYTFYIGHTGDALIVLAITLGTYGFKLRRYIFIEESCAANWWEFSLTLLFTVNAIFVATGVYDSRYFAFLDIPLHLGGGIIVGWWAYLVLAKKDGSLMLDWKRSLIFIIGAAALLGVAWEIFEWGLDHTVGIWYVVQKAQPSLDDTMADLSNDLLGGLAVGIALLRSRRSNR